MQKVKTLTTLLFVIMSSVAFAQAADVDFGGNSQPPTNSIPPAPTPSQSVDWLMIGLITLLIVIVIGRLGYIIYVVCEAFKKHFNKLEALAKKVDGPGLRLVPASDSKEKGRGSIGNNSVEDSAKITLLTKSIDNLSNNQTEAQKATSKSCNDILSKLETLSTSGFVSSINECSNSIDQFKSKLNEILIIAPEIKKMNEQMETIREENPAFANLSIRNAVELVNQCHAEGLTTAEVIHDTIATARAIKVENSTLNNKIKSLQDDVEQKTKDIEKIEEDRKRLYQLMNILRPEAVDVDSLLVILKDLSPELRAETLVLVIQLYWFAQLSHNAPNKIKAAFTKFDETLFELYLEKQNLLQSIRQSIQKFINDEVFKNTSYKVLWPALNSSASEHEDYYNRENDEGNRICKVRSATIFNAGNIESVARIYTSL